MDFDDARAFIAEHHLAVLTTLRPDGRPQMSPVTVGTDDEGRVVVSSRETAYKVRHLRRDPRASLCVLAPDFHRWIYVDGAATVVSLPDAMDGLVRYYRQVAGEHPDWDEYRRAMQDQQRVLIVVEMERVGPTRHG